MSSNSRSRRRNSAGQALIAVLGVIVVLGIMVSLALSVADFTHSSTTKEGRTQQAVQSADAAVNQYIGRLVEDPYYYLHFVDDAEDTRYVGSTPYAHGSDFATSGAFQWSYGSAGVQQWRPLVTDDNRQAVKGPYGLVEYSLRVSPSIDGLTTTVTGTARVGGTGPGSVIRSVEARVRPQSVSDFQVISDGTESYTSRANGKIMIVNGDLIFGDEFTGGGALISHGYLANDGYATGRICSNGGCGLGTSVSSTFYDTAGHEYLAGDTTPTVSQRYPNPVDFSLFSRDLQNTKNFATGAGTYWGAGQSPWGWLIQYTSGGTYNLWKINQPWDPQSATPLSATGSLTQVRFNEPLPSPIAVMYFEQPLVISDASNGRNSVVNGRVTAVSGTQVYFGGNVTYADRNDDVLGVISSGGVTVGRSVPNPTADIWSSIISVGAMFSGADCSGNYDHTTFNFTGTRVEKQACFNHLFQYRVWTYDDKRQEFVPPLFPILQGSYKVQSWREVTTPGA